MLPLSRFPKLISGDRDEAFLSIKSRHPGVHDFHARGGVNPWSININHLDLGRGHVAASQTSACSLSVATDGFVRVYYPLTQPFEINIGRTSYSFGPRVALWGPVHDFQNHFKEGARTLIGAFPQVVVRDTLRCFDDRLELSSLLDTHFGVSPYRLDTFRRQLVSLMMAFEDGSEGMIHEQRFRRAQEELLLLHLAQSIASFGAFKSDLPDASPVLSRALEFINAHVCEEIGPLAIARAAGCSLRNLQVLFRRQFQQTITEYMRGRRLHLARERLLRPSDGDTITTIAISCGFSHLSDFARHYQGTFGEKPSHTLAAARRIGLC